tara:strand:- start:1353 stop:1721 length:369 start_codon:yes stop_codon:yes gene_type:complete
MFYYKVDALASLKPGKQWSRRAEEDDYSGFVWDEGETIPTDAEIEAELLRLTNAEPMRLLRLERDARLAKTDWMSFSDSPTMSDDWKTYRQALRDLPASATPKLGADGHLDMSSVTFPTEPS